MTDDHKDELRKSYFIDEVREFIGKLENFIDDENAVVTVSNEYCRDTVQGLLLMSILLSKHMGSVDNLCDFLKAAWAITPGLGENIEESDAEDGSDGEVLH